MPLSLSNPIHASPTLRLRAKHMIKLLLLSSDHYAAAAAVTVLLILCIFNPPLLTVFQQEIHIEKCHFVRFQLFYVKLPWRSAGNLTWKTRWRRLPLSALFFSILAQSKTDKMKLDWTRSNRGSCEGTALWLILCSFNKLSAKGPRLSSKQAAFTLFSSPLLHLSCFLLHPMFRGISRVQENSHCFLHVQIYNVRFPPADFPRCKIN